MFPKFTFTNDSLPKNKSEEMCIHLWWQFSTNMTGAKNHDPNGYVNVND